MPRRKKAKPHDPAAAERFRAEREAQREMATAIQAQPSTAINRDPHTGRLTGAWRLNCFNALLPHDSPERKAVDWLDDLICTAAGENGQERRPDFIRATTDGAPGQHITAQMIKAGETLQAVTEAMAPGHVRMLFDLLKPDESLITRWRAVVQRCTGETIPNAQSAAVRAACTSLAHVRANADRLVKDRASRRAIAA